MLESPYSAPKILPPPEHPRVLLRKADLPRIRENMKVPENAHIVQLWENLCQPLSPELIQRMQEGKYHITICQTIEAKALKGLLYPRLQDPEEVIWLLVTMVENYCPQKAAFVARYGGHVLFVAAMVYDWYHEYLSRETKQTILFHCERIAEASLEMGYPPAGQTGLTGHGCEAQLLRDLLSFSIACYDERPDIYNYCAGRIFDEYLPDFDYFYHGRISPAGPDYGVCRYAYCLWMGILIRTMSGQQVLSEDVVKTAESFFYLLRPDDQPFRLGDMVIERVGDRSQNHMLLSYLMAVSLLAWAYTGERRYYDEFCRVCDDRKLVLCDGDIAVSDGGTNESNPSPTIFFLLHGMHPEVSSQPLEICRYFGSPVGMTIWNDKQKDTAILMKIGEVWTSNHEHLDMGCFQIYHRGILASDSGIYENYGAEHFCQYLTRTSAHNCLTVTDPDGAKKLPFLKALVNNDGGVRHPFGGVKFRGYGSEARDYRVLDRDYRMGKVLYHREDADGCEITGDLTQAYADRCDKVIRNMLFDAREGAYGTFTVTDEVTTKKAEFIKTFHLHCQQEPQVEGRQITISNAGGKLRCTVLEPEDPVITVIGGDGMRFVVCGENFYPDINKLQRTNSGRLTLDQEQQDTYLEGGWGQIQIRPAKASLHDRFVVKMEVLDGFQKCENEV